jgi:hypothetical protein
MTEELEDPAELMRMMAMKLHAKWNIELPLRMGDRIKIAFSCGYMCAKHMAYMKETYGFPLESYVDQFRKRVGPLKVDYSGLRGELMMMGSSENSTESMLQELRVADKDWSNRHIAAEEPEP